MKKVLLVMIAVMFVASFAYASAGTCGECKACGNLKSDNLMNVYGARLCNGVCNTALGWSEIFFRPGKVVAEGGNCVVGFFRGLGNALTRTAGGIVEIATFWTPGDSVANIDNCPLCAYK